MMTKKIKSKNCHLSSSNRTSLRRSEHTKPLPPSLSLSLSVSEAASMAWRGNLSKSIKELRFLFCQTSPASSHTRDFVLKNYTDLKTKNPKLPILIRECSGVQPQIWARYDMGVERCVRLDGLTAEQINAKLEELGKAANLNKVQLPLFCAEVVNLLNLHYIDCS
ncbi:NADH dehydrogenase [ubiquinone] 1 alpha subcomplex subunit 2 [Rhynchospora pubera]|uniref:NADH dehydrogenase [ubiquinone] 1 alpha subcomplex subunit 2 n=1 Tax=Rhynchospora pubera TaxID=906938 RepID=A0AAV8CB87_9POAL|nr:NADH dehydrogenase [ubiquinone] 1 alpha subcomplex subunit 2 [Rhynchospora pubera]